MISKPLARYDLLRAVAVIAMGVLMSPFVTGSAVAETKAQADTTVMQCSEADHPRYTKTPSGYLVVLRMGDNAIEELTKLIIAEQIPSASLTAIGFANVKFGFWNKDKKDFDSKVFERVEMASIIGSLAWKEGKPSIHMHGVAGGSSFQAYGGHILDLEVATGSLEMTVIVHDRRLERSIDPCIGANVLGL